MKHIKFFKSYFLTESKMYIAMNEVPKEITNWAIQKIGNTFSKKIAIQHETEVEITIPWHEADREYYQFFKLIDKDTAKIAGDPVHRSGLEGDGVITGNEVNGKVSVPSGYVLACAGTYPHRLTLFTSSDALKALPDANILDQFTIEELLILLAAKCLKSPYRPKYKDASYENLIKNGYLAPNRSITIKGKNIAATPGIEDKINKYAKPLGLYLSGSYKLEKDFL